MPVLSNPDVKKHLEELNQKCYIVTIDKASNNFTFPCRRYCRLLAEVSHIKIKVRHQHIHKLKHLRRSLLKLTSNIENI